jgi:hypothetical protein
MDYRKADSVEFVVETPSTEKISGSHPKLSAWTTAIANICAKEVLK